MNEIVIDAFRRMIADLQDEVADMPLDCWTESVFRYNFCRAIARSRKEEIKQFVECGKIDLVLHRPQSDDRAFIEFKFYRHPRRHDPYGRPASGYKGGPGRKNRDEFAECVDVLHNRDWIPNLSKYIVLVYSDPTDGRKRVPFSKYYEPYHHRRDEVQLNLIDERKSELTDDMRVTCRLYQVSPLISESEPQTTAAD